MDRRFRRALLIAIGATRQEAGTQFLMARIAPGDPDAEAAMEGLAPLKFRGEVRRQVESAVQQTGSAALTAEFRKLFGSSELSE